MKHVNKFIAFLIVTLMFISISATALAAEAGSITVNGATAEKDYEIYKIFDMTGNADYSSVAYTIDSEWKGFFTSTGSKYLVANNSGDLSQITVDGAKKFINITETNVAEFAQDALAYANKNNIPADRTTKANGTKVNFNNLNLGYYLVYPKGATDIKDENASICSLTSTNPNATVNVKADYPTIEKKVDESNVEIGQTVTYTITGKVPDTTGFTAYEYTVKDKMSNGLTFNADVANMEIKFGEAKINDVNPEYSDNGFTLKFDMTKYQTHKGKAITITYSATVNENAVNGKNESGNENQATLTYSNDPRDGSSKTTTPPEIVDVYTAGIKINKHDAKEEATKLEGAKFVLRNANNKFYKYEDNKVTWVDEAAATVVTTQADGTGYFKGLKNGTYYLKEVEAPEGYNLLTDEINVEINYENQSTQVYADADVANESGTILPSTGGQGTLVFYAVGVLMIIVSALAYNSRRLSSDEIK